MTPHVASDTATPTSIGNLSVDPISDYREPSESTSQRNRDRTVRQSAAAILWPERQKLFRSTAAFTLVFGIFAFLMPRQWESRATLMPPDQSSSTSSALQGLIAAKADAGLGVIASDMLGVRNPTMVLAGVLGSETVERELVDKFDLRDVYKRKLYIDAEKILKKRTDIEEVRLSGMITIRVTDTDPVRARDLVQAYVDAANRLVAQLTTSSAHRERLFLEDRLKSIKQDLDNSSLALSQFSSKTRTMNPEAQGRAMLTASADLQGHLIAAQAELRSLQQKYSADNVRVRSASARVAELRGQLDAMAGAGDPETGYSAADRAQQLYPSMRELPLLDNTYENLYRRAQIQEAVYEALTKQYEMAKVQEAKEIPSVRLLDTPRIPERKSWPPRTLIALLGGMLGFIVAALWVLASEAVSAFEPADPRRVAMAKISRASAFLFRWRPSLVASKR